MCGIAPEVQTRDECGQLKFFETLRAAFEHAERDPTVWKISFEAATGERVRLVWGADGRWIYEDIMGEALKALEKEGKL